MKLSIVFGRQTSRFARSGQPRPPHSTALGINALPSIRVIRVVQGREVDVGVLFSFLPSSPADPAARASTRHRLPVIAGDGLRITRREGYGKPVFRFVHVCNVYGTTLPGESRFSSRNIGPGTTHRPLLVQSLELVLIPYLSTSPYSIPS